jgi:histidinol-phosphate aminotransferase
MGLLDYYKQFEALSEEEVNEELRATARERKRQELAHSDTLDLSQTTWPDLPHASVVNAITFAARSGLQRYPHAAAAELRNELAHRHDLKPSRVALGNGAAQLLGSAARALLRAGQELVMPWPSYPLFPVLAARAGATAVPVRLAGDLGVAAASEGLLAAVGERTRAVVIASPNDPSGELFGMDPLRALLEGLPENVAVLLDEALIDFCRAQPTDASLGLLEEHPRLIVFRTLSKAWGLAGLRFGYALGGPGAEDMLAQLEPDLGVGELTQVGALEALRNCSRQVAGRCQRLARERTSLAGSLRRRGFEVADSEANFLWCRHGKLSGDELAARLGSAGVLVASGATLGEPGHVRITVPSATSAARLLEVLEAVLPQR